MPPGLRLLAAAAALTVAGLACLAVPMLGATRAPDGWTSAGVALLAASALLHWRSSRASR